MNYELDVKYTMFRHMRKPKQLLMIPLTFWSGIEQGFFGADFTAVNRTRNRALYYADYTARELRTIQLAILIAYYFYLICLTF